MPKYRLLHTKIIDSFDFNEMPNDFARVVWMLLIVIVDSSGRAIDNPAWLRSKMFPMRQDVQLKPISEAIDWFASRGMIVKYEHDGKKYFYIPTFKDHQVHTEREAPSVLPSPENSTITNSGVTQDEVRSKSGTSVVVVESVVESVKEEIPEKLNTPGFVEMWSRWVEYRREIKNKLTPSTIKSQLKMLEKFGPDIGAKMLDQSITNSWRGIFELKSNGNGSKQQTRHEKNMAVLKEFMDSEEVIIDGNQ